MSGLNSLHMFGCCCCIPEYCVCTALQEAFVTIHGAGLGTLIAHMQKPLDLGMFE